MFYSQLLLQKKTPLGRLWLAAHWDKSLNKQTVAQIDIEEFSAELTKPQVPLALRVSGQLLLGLARIYSRKVVFLLNDCSDALTRIQTAGKATDLDLPRAQQAGGAGINLPAGSGGAGGGGGGGLDLSIHDDDFALLGHPHDDDEDFHGAAGQFALVGDSQNVLLDGAGGVLLGRDSDAFGMPGYEMAEGGMHGDDDLDEFGDAIELSRGQRIGSRGMGDEHDDDAPGIERLRGPDTTPARSRASTGAPFSEARNSLADGAAAAEFDASVLRAPRDSMALSERSGTLLRGARSSLARGGDLDLDLGEDGAGARDDDAAAADAYMGGGFGGDMGMGGYGDGLGGGLEDIQIDADVLGTPAGDRSAQRRSRRGERESDEASSDVPGGLATVDAILRSESASGTAEAKTAAVRRAKGRAAAADDEAGDDEDGEQAAASTGEATATRGSRAAERNAKRRRVALQASSEISRQEYKVWISNPQPTLLAAPHPVQRIRHLELACGVVADGAIPAGAVLPGADRRPARSGGVAPSAQLSSVAEQRAHASLARSAAFPEMVLAPALATLLRTAAAGSLAAHAPRLSADQRAAASRCLAAHARDEGARRGGGSSAGGRILSGAERTAAEAGSASAHARSAAMAARRAEDAEEAAAEASAVIPPKAAVATTLAAEGVSAAARRSTRRASAAKETADNGDDDDDADDDDDRSRAAADEAMPEEFGGGGFGGDMGAGGYGDDVYQAEAAATPQRGAAADDAASVLESVNDDRVERSSLFGGSARRDGDARSARGDDDFADDPMLSASTSAAAQSARQSPELRRAMRQLSAGATDGVSSAGTSNESFHPRALQMVTLLSGVFDKARPTSSSSSSRSAALVDSAVRLEDLIAGHSRRTAAVAFYELLVLKAKGVVEVSQTRPYGPIAIRKTDTFDGVASAAAAGTTSAVASEASSSAAAAASVPEAPPAAAPVATKARAKGRR